MLRAAEPKARLVVDLSTSLVYVSHEGSVLVVYGMIISALEGTRTER
jgi:hypothetical protein